MSNDFSLMVWANYTTPDFELSVYDPQFDRKRPAWVWQMSRHQVDSHIWAIRGERNLEFRVQAGTIGSLRLLQMSIKKVRLPVVSFEYEGRHGLTPLHFDNAVIDYFSTEPDYYSMSVRYTHWVGLSAPRVDFYAGSFYLEYLKVVKKWRSQQDD